MTTMIQTNSQQPGDPTVVIDALIEGLRNSKKTLNEKCKRALLSLGRRAVPGMQAAANDPDTSTAHRRRVEQVLGMISDSEDMAAKASMYVANALLDALRVDNMQLNEKAIAAFAVLPWRTIDLLIATAIDSDRSSPRYCARLLKAADAVDEIPNVMLRIDLIRMMSSTDETVRVLARDLVCKLQFRDQN
jgi:hypothetical protein